MVNSCDRYSAGGNEHFYLGKDDDIEDKYMCYCMTCIPTPLELRVIMLNIFACDNVKYLYGSYISKELV